MKKTLLFICFMISILGGYTAFVFSNVSSVRDNITEISSTSGYKEEFDISVYNIIQELNIDNVHFNWIAEFVAKELHRSNSLNDTEIYFKRKVLNKDVKFTKSAGIQIKFELLKLKELNIKRKNEVDLAMKEYKEMLDRNTYTAFVEEIFFGGSIKINDIKYY